MLVAFSQINKNETRTQGTVTYEEVVKFDIVVDGMSPEMMDMMPKENRTNTVLHFNDEVSRYENLKVGGDVSMEEETGEGTVKIMMSQPENIIYRDLRDKRIITQTEFMSRVFLIESDLPNDEWKLTGNQQMILGYPCQEAIKEDTARTIKVWFTPAIPVSTGPGEYGNLPGLVLTVDINEGERTITVKSIGFEYVDPAKLGKPKKGKKVTREKFNSIVEEKNKEMGAEGGGQTIIMKISQ